MNSEPITKQLMHLYTLHTQPHMIISPDGEIRTEIYRINNEAEKLFNVLQKYLAEMRLKKNEAGILEASKVGV